MVSTKIFKQRKKPEYQTTKKWQYSSTKNISFDQKVLEK